MAAYEFLVATINLNTENSLRSTHTHANMYNKYLGSIADSTGAHAAK